MQIAILITEFIIIYNYINNWVLLYIRQALFSRQKPNTSWPSPQWSASFQLVCHYIHKIIIV